MQKIKDESLLGTRLLSGPDWQEAAPLLTLSSSTILKDLLVEWELWTPAVFCTYGGFTYDPATEFFRWASLIQPLCRRIQLPRPIFTLPGKWDPEWERNLWLCEKNSWGILARFLKQLGGVNRDWKTLSLVMLQRVDIPDVLSLERGLTPESFPKVTIHGLGTDTSYGIFGLVPSTNNQLPTIHRMPPSARLLKMAKNVLKEEPHWPWQLSYFLQPETYNISKDIPPDE